jgi:hypothetical protein
MSLDSGMSTTEIGCHYGINKLTVRFIKEAEDKIL